MNEKTMNKKPYTSPKLTTHGDVAKLTLSSCDSEPSGCHSHLPRISCLPTRPGRGCR
jgi:hypothetical protein